MSERAAEAFRRQGTYEGVADAALWYEVRSFTQGNGDRHQVTREQAHAAASELARRHPELEGAAHYVGPMLSKAETEADELRKLLAEAERERDEALALASAPPALPEET